MRIRSIPGLLEYNALTRAAAPSMTPNSFMVCPVVLLSGQSLAQLNWQTALYQLAFEQAQATERPSLPERDLLAVWN